jgi:hypothetical protein
MKMQARTFVVSLLASTLYCPAGLGAPAGVETSSDPSFDTRLFPKLAVIVVEEGAERTSVSVQRSGAKRSTTILFADQTRLERAVEDEFVSALMNKGYTLSTRSDLLSILKEQTIQDLSLTEDNSAGIGKVLKVQAVMLVRVNGFQAVPVAETARRPATPKATGSMGARLMSVEGAKILWTGRCSQTNHRHRCFKEFAVRSFGGQTHRLSFSKAGGGRCGFQRICIGGEPPDIKATANYVRSRARAGSCTVRQRAGQATSGGMGKVTRRASRDDQLHRNEACPDPAGRV